MSSNLSWHEQKMRETMTHLHNTDDTDTDTGTHCVNQPFTGKPVTLSDFCFYCAYIHTEWHTQAAFLHLHLLFWIQRLFEQNCGIENFFFLLFHDFGSKWWAVGLFGYSRYTHTHTHTHKHTHTHYCIPLNYLVSHILTSCCVSFQRPEGNAELSSFDMQRKHFRHRLTEWAAVWDQGVVESYSPHALTFPLPCDFLLTLPWQHSLL